MAWDETPPEKIDSKNWDAEPPKTEELSGLVEPSAIEALMRGGAQGGTFGFADELTGAGETALDALRGKLEKSLGDTYTQHRNESREAYKAAEDTSPYIYGAGQIAGGLVSGLATGGLGAAAEGATLGARALQAAGAGAVAGGLTGAGQATELSDIPSNVIVGGAVGGVLGGALQPVAETVVPRVAGFFDKVAAKRALSAVGGGKRAAEKLINQNRVQDVGDTLLEKTPFGDKPVVTAFAGAEKMLDRTEKVLENSGQFIGDVAQQLDNGTEINPELRNHFVNPTKIAKQIEDLQQKVSLKNTKPSVQENIPDWLETTAPLKNVVGKETTIADPINKQAYADLQDALESISHYGNEPINFAQAQDLKNRLSKAAYDNKGFLKNDEMGDVLRIVNKEIEQAMDSSTKALGKPELIDKYLQAKQTYGAASEARRGLIKQQAGHISNRDFGLTDYMTGLSAAAAHGTPIGLAAVGVKKIAQTYGNQIAAVGAKKIAGGLRAVNKAFVSDPAALKSLGNGLQSSEKDVERKLGHVLLQAADRDDTGRNALIFSLMQIPQYRELMKKIAEHKGE